MYPGSVISSSNINQFLLKAEKDVSELFSGTDNSVSTTSTSWASKTEIRFSSQSNDEQSYALRIQPKSLDMIFAENTIISLNAIQYGMKYDSALNNALKTRYLYIIEILQRQYDIYFENQLIKLAQNKVSQYQYEAQTIKFSPIRLLKAELELNQRKMQVKLKREQYQTLVSESDLKIERKDKIPSLSWKEWLKSTKEILGSVKNEIENNNYIKTNIKLVRDQINLKLAKQKLVRTIEKNSFGISFIELKYFSKKVNEKGISIGIEIPFGGSSTDKIRSKYDVFEAKSELRISERNATLRQNQDRVSLKSLLDQTNIIQSSLLEISDRLKIISKSNNPELLLGLKQEELRQAQLLQNTYINVLRQYIGFLHYSGKLSEKPLRNWLHNETHELDGVDNV